MLSFFKKFVPRLFISVILGEQRSTLRTASYANGKFTNAIEKSFENPKKLLAYIKNSHKKYLYHHVSLFLDNEEQWLIPSLNTDDFKNFSTTKVSVKSIILGNARLYTATEHIEYFSELFEDCDGLDFLFSPLALLYYCVQKEKLEADRITLCVYKHSNSLALMACKGNEILIGEFKLFKKDFDLGLDNFEHEETIDATDGHIEREDKLENFNENLDKEFADEFDISDKKQRAEFDEFSNFSDDMQFCNYIISSIGKFYKDTRYAGDFVDRLLIFTNEDITQSALEFLENEIFLTPQVRSLNSLDLMMELMQKELKI